MAYEFRLPDIGEGLTEAEIVGWRVKVGEAVAVDQVLVEVETDKAVVEIPSPRAGTLLHQGAGGGETLAVGEILAVIGDPGEQWPPAPGPAQPSAEERQRLEEAAATQEGMPEPPPAAAPIVGTLSETAEDLTPRTRVTPNDGKRPVSPQALPLVRKLASELGVDLGSVAGSGPGGRITREDVIAASQGSPPRGPGPELLPPLVVDRTGERRRLSKLRRTIASNLVRSWTEIPHVTTFDAVDASRLLATRQALAGRHQRRIPMEALLIKAVIPALVAHPEFNASLEGEDLVLAARHDLGVAVDTPDGLLVAVVRTAADLGLLEIAAEVERLTEGARQRRLAPEELSGQTFTVSNIGAVGGGYGTPIIPPGNTAILSVGRAVEKPIVREGSVAIAPMMPLSLSYDHRVIDGALGRRFISMVIENLAEPALFLA
jgi:pyruvate dehydrogenase E2 component (dihydrolipoamide acetyltransferase)